MAVTAQTLYQSVEPTGAGLMVLGSAFGKSRRVPLFQVGYDALVHLVCVKFAARSTPFDTVDSYCSVLLQSNQGGWHCTGGETPGQ
jgi:hypothetical protein